MMTFKAISPVEEISIIRSGNIFSNSTTIEFIGRFLNTARERGFPKNRTFDSNEWDLPSESKKGTTLTFFEWNLVKLLSKNIKYLELSSD